MLCIIGAGAKQSDGVRDYLETYNNENFRIRKEYLLDAKTDEIYSELIGASGNFHIKEVIENPTYRDFFKLCCHPEYKAILPNAPLCKGSYDCFRRTNDVLTDYKRDWFQADIDWVLEEGQTMTMPLADRADFSLKKLGVPASVGYVAQLSSSAWIDDERKPKKAISIRIYFLLNRPMNQQELQEAFRDVNIDPAMCESSRLHIIDYPLIADGIEILETEQDVIIKNGDRLDPSVLPKTKTSEYNYNPPTKDMRENLEVTIKTPNLRFLMREAKYDYTNPHDHLAYYEENADSLDGRNLLFYETLKQCFRVSGTYEPFYSEWNKVREDSSKEVWDKIRGQHKMNYLSDKIKAIDKEFLENTTCGNVRKAFKKENKTIIDINSDYIYQDPERVDRELKDFTKDGGILLMKAGCGSGKTTYVLDKVYQIANRPNRYCFITFRKSLIDQTILKCEERYRKKKHTFKPNHYERYGTHIEFQQERPNAGSLKPESIRRRKEEFLPKCNNPIVCIDSLHYLENNGIEEAFEVVFIDEIEHVLEGLWREANADDFDTVIENRGSAWIQLVKICAKAKYVILADDKASNDLTGWFVNEVATNATKKTWLLYNQKDLLSKKTIIDISKKPSGYHLLKAKKIAESGKVVALQTNRALESLKGDIYALIDQGIPEEAIFAICAKECFSSFKEEYTYQMGSDSSLANDYRKNPNKVIPWLIEKGVKIFIHSPWNGVGWDYDGEGIDAVIVKLLYFPRIDSKDAIQYMSRFRLCDLIYICVPSRDEEKQKDILERLKGESRRL